MAGVCTLVLITLLGIQMTYGMDCSLGTSENIVDEFINHCPRPLLDSEDEKYCCWHPDRKIVKCCNLVDFIVNSVAISWPIVLIVLIVLFIVSCICCVCCCKRGGGRCI